MRPPGRLHQATLITIMLALVAMLWPQVATATPTSDEVGQSIADTIDAAQANKQANDAQAGQIEALQKDFAGLLDDLDELRQINAALTTRVAALEAGNVTPTPEPDPDPTPTPDPEPAPMKTSVTGDWVLGRLLAGQKEFNDLIISGGVAVIWKRIDDVTFNRCDFRDATTHLTVQAKDDGSAACSNWTFKNCTFKNATRSDWGHSHGCFLMGVRNFTFIDCVWEHNGWIGDARFNQNHNVYLDARRDADHPTWAINENITFRGCQFIEAAAQGVKMRGIYGLQFKDCVFRGNLIDLANDTRSPSSGLVIDGCTFIDTGGTDSGGYTLGWSIHLKSPTENPLADAEIINCKWIGPGVHSGTKWSGTIGILLQEAGVKKVLVKNPDFSQWDGEKTIRNEIGDRLTIK